MKTYKMRAEALCDVVGEGGFFAQCRAANVAIWSYKIVNNDGRFGDVVVTLETHASLRLMRKVLSHVIDGHCMLRTVAHVDDYTGEQYYLDGE